MLNKLIIFCFILIKVFDCFAQTFPVRQYTPIDELANSNVYDILQDTEGYMWFATDNGISRFDGSKFTNFNIEDGLPTNSIISLAIDQEGNIYAGTKRRGIYKLQKGRFNLVVADSRSDYPNNKIVITKDYYYTLKNTTNLYAFLKDNPTIPIEIKFPPQTKLIYFCKTSNNQVYVTTSSGFFEINDTTAKPFEITELKNKLIDYLTERDDTLFVASENLIYTIYKNIVKSKNQLPLNSKELINNFLIDDYQNTWYSTFDANNFYCNIQGKSIPFHDKLQLYGISVNDIVKDNEGNIWIATFGKGVFCFHHLFATHYGNDEGLSVPNITYLENGNKDDLFIGTYNGLFYWNKHHFYHIKNSGNRLEYILGIDLKGDTIYIASSIAKQGSVKIKNIPYTITYTKSSSVLASENIQVSGRWDNNIFISIKGKIDTINLSLESNNNRINAFYLDKDKNLYCGTNFGLFKISVDKKIISFHQSEFQNQINTIKSDGSGKLFIGTSNGLFVLKQDEIDYEAQKKYKEIRNNVTSIEFDNENRAWIGTLSGLYFSDNKKIIAIDARSGLINDEVTSLAYNKEENKLLIGANGGLTVFDLTKFDKLPSFAPEVNFRNIRTQDGVFRIENDTTLPYYRNNFTIRFSAINFTNPGGVKFYFKLDDTKWQVANGRQVEFAGLPYGKHTISLKAENDKREQGQVKTLNITIQTPYWATIWFKIFVGFIIASIIFYFIRWRFIYEKRKQKEQLELQNKISELRHQSLNTSMNPHFIFNSLNSIQQFINTHNTEEASDYLGKFARLIRLILNNGNKSYIKLEEELDRLNRYLELEKIRFGDKLNYQIIVQDNIDIHTIEIPNMILQPFIENAIWHGILPSHKSGNIKVTFNKQGEFINVSIEDDGIGILESKNRKKNNHKSLGMQMITERIDLLSKLNGNQITLEIKDKCSLSSQEHGTVIEISMPLQHTSAIE